MAEASAAPPSYTSRGATPQCAAPVPFPTGSIGCATLLASIHITGQRGGKIS